MSDEKQSNISHIREHKMRKELERRRSYLDKLKGMALFAKNQQDRVLDIQNTTASLAQQDFKLRKLRRDFPLILSRNKQPGVKNDT